MISLEKLVTCPLPKTATEYRDNTALKIHLGADRDIAVEQIGFSRSGQELFGYRMGDGQRAVSITAGCHADEPIGPMTAQILPQLIREHAPELLEHFTFRVAPQMNPDGADANRAWFSSYPDFLTYVAHAVREAPGDDIEFGFSEETSARPECRAAIPFLWHDSPVQAHFSLHGMAWAEGAWYLLNAPWADRSEALIEDLLRLTDIVGMGLHEIDRKGAKGFSRICKGFSTTPSSVAMREFFEQENDPDMAAKFLPSSMEVAMKTGDDPLCMVSELPLFVLNVAPSLEAPVLFQFRDALNEARSQGGTPPLVELIKRFNLSTVPLETMIRMQFAMIVGALRHVLSTRLLPDK